MKIGRNNTNVVQITAVEGCLRVQAPLKLMLNSCKQAKFNTVQRTQVETIFSRGSIVNLMRACAQLQSARTRTHAHIAHAPEESL